MLLCLFYIFFFFLQVNVINFFFFFSSRRRHTRSLCDWSSDCALPISADVDGDVGRPQLRIPVLPRRVGPDQRHRGGQQQGRTTGGLGVQEVGQRPQDQWA